MNVSIIVATFGHTKWKHLAQQRALPSACGQGAHEAFCFHLIEGGLAQARNDAAMHASGDWLCFLDADDSLCPGYIEAMQRELLVAHHGDPERAEAAVQRWGFSRSAGFDPKKLAERPFQDPVLLVPAVEYPGSRPVIPAWGRPMIDVNCCVIGTLVPRQLFHAVGGFRDVLSDGLELPAPGLEDWDFWLRCVLAGARLVPAPAAVYCASGRPGGGSHNMVVYHRIRAEHEAAYRVLQQAGHAP